MGEDARKARPAFFFYIHVLFVSPDLKFGSTVPAVKGLVSLHFARTNCWS